MKSESLTSQLASNQDEFIPSGSAIYYQKLFQKYQALKANFIQINKCIKETIGELQPQVIPFPELKHLWANYLNKQIADDDKPLLTIDFKHQSHLYFVDTLKYHRLPSWIEIQLLSVWKWSQKHGCASTSSQTAKALNLFLENSIPK